MPINNKFLITAISLAFYACSGNKENDKDVIWAEVVESKTNVLKPEGFQDEYWSSINQKVDYSKIYNVIIEAVLRGEKNAYDILSDKNLSKAEVRKLIGFKNGKSATYDISNLSALRMREEWIFNEKKFTLTKKVKRVDLLLKKVDPVTGEYLGDKALFYVKLDE